LSIPLRFLLCLPGRLVILMVSVRVSVHHEESEEYQDGFKKSALYLLLFMSFVIFVAQKILRKWR